MPEKLNNHKRDHEATKPHHETREAAAESHRKVAEHLNRKSSESAHHRSEKSHAESAVEKAKKAEEVLANLHSESKENSPTHTNHTLRSHSFTRIMSKTRKQLKPTDRVFSKVIHNPIVDQVSEGLGKTVYRPSGVIGAGVVSFIGLSIVLYYAKTNGFEMPPSLLLLLISAGFVSGWLVEALLGLKKKLLK